MHKYTLSDIQKYSKKYLINKEDIIYILLNILGVRCNTNMPRIRANIRLQDKSEYFYFGLANNPHSPFHLEKGKVYFQNDNIAEIKGIENDDCASSYFRRNKTVLTINSNKRSNCRGCQFCPNNLELNSEDENLNTTNKINIMSLSKREHSCIMSPQKAKKLIKNGFLEFYDSQDFNLVFFVMGDALYAEAEKIRKSLKKHKKIYSKILYFYNVFSLINLSEKQLVKITQNKHILFFFPGYINAIKGIMFNKISKEKISFYGYSNKYISGNTTQKIEANGIAYKNIVKELQHLRLL